MFKPQLYFQSLEVAKYVRSSHVILIMRLLKKETNYTIRLLGGTALRHPVLLKRIDETCQSSVDVMVLLDLGNYTI